MFYIQPYQWKWVCSQHPMVLISRDQTSPRALETVPPWGGEDIHGYCVKMYEMLQKVLDTPEMKIDFDLSAKELLIFFEEIEDGKPIMKTLLAEGRLGFLGGDYAQAHYHEARSESALRQLRMGMKVFKDELGVEIDTFQHQETGLFENLPQLLLALGITKSAIHTFVSTFEFLEAPSLEIVSNFGRLELVHRESFASWRGLDGSCLPIYLPIVQNHLPTHDEVDIVFGRYMSDPDYEGVHAPKPRAYQLYPTGQEENRGMYRNASIIVECPDLVSLDDDYIQNRKRVGSFYLMSEALDEELQLQSHLPKIRYYTYWSYCEGQFGEKMFKAYRESEAKLLRAETMRVLAERLGAAPGAFDADAAWDRLLTAQHHDVNWIDTDELKAWALSEIDKSNAGADAYVQAAAEAILDKNAAQEGDHLTVFNTLPVRRRALVWADADGARASGLPSQRIDGKLCFFADMDGLGAKSYALEKDDRPKPAEEPVGEVYVFENDLMRVKVLKDGRIESLCSKLSGERMQGFGNLIRGQLVEPDKRWRWIGNDRAEARATVEKGELFDVVRVSGTMDAIPYRMRICLPHGASGQIDFELDIDFDHTAIGDFYHDESKLTLSWETCQQRPEILIDEPFGALNWRSDRPIHAANYVALTEGGLGIVYTHYGTPKSYVKGGTLSNVIAWGGNNFSNRHGWGWSSMDIFDMRLNGTAHYRYSIAIAEDKDVARISAAAQSDVTPPVAVRGAGIRDSSLLSVLNPNLIPTAVEQLDGRTVVRAYEIAGRETRVELIGALGQPERTDIAGTRQDGANVRPYEVFELRFS